MLLLFILCECASGGEWSASLSEAELLELYSPYERCTLAQKGLLPKAVSSASSSPTATEVCPGDHGTRPMCSVTPPAGNVPPAGCTRLTNASSFTVGFLDDGAVAADGWQSLREANFSRIRIWGDSTSAYDVAAMTCKQPRDNGCPGGHDHERELVEAEGLASGFFLQGGVDNGSACVFVGHKRMNTLAVAGVFTDYLNATLKEASPTARHAHIVNIGLHMHLRRSGEEKVSVFRVPFF
jgi:hypothetical protein